MVRRTPLEALQIDHISQRRYKHALALALKNILIVARLTDPFLRPRDFLYATVEVQWSFGVVLPSRLTGGP